MTERETLLQKLDVGDIFHAESPNGASLICLATRIDEAIIYARTVTTQYRFQFDRRTGGAVCGDGSVCFIDSVAPLPLEIHNVMLGIDRKYRLEREEERFKLNDVEKKALIFVDTYYRENQL
ncbi:hypothetical protein [Cupriavidus basilensis]|uniref:hypothetical protein n=1 Tax=Cupriavidus basilensis TaxID=68895 RepID=UPI0039F6B188